MPNTRQKRANTPKAVNEDNMKLLSTTLVILSLASPALASGKIERACNNSERNASRSLCKCIQRVANNELTRSDQKRAAKFFKDPHLAQETRQSDSETKEKFWKRYKEFGKLAATSCQ